MSRTLSEFLWDENSELALRILQHPFVQSLADGTLPEDSFRRYIAQDAFFLEAFARAYAMAAANSPDRGSLEVFCDLLQGVREELDLHADYADKWNVDLNQVEPIQATTAYTTFLHDTARGGDIGLICAAMTPCMRLYAWLGQKLSAQYGVPDHVYGSWIRTYSDRQFEELASRLETLLDNYAVDAPDIRAIYNKAMELEYRFFDAHISSGTSTDKDSG